MRFFRPAGDRHLHAIFGLLSEAQAKASLAPRSDGNHTLKHVQLGAHLRRAVERDAMLIGPNALQGVEFNIEGTSLMLQVQIGSEAETWLGMHPHTTMGDEHCYQILEGYLVANVPISAAKAAISEVFGSSVYFGPKTCQACLTTAFHRVESERTRADMTKIPLVN